MNPINRNAIEDSTGNLGPVVGQFRPGLTVVDHKKRNIRCHIAYFLQKRSERNKQFQTTVRNQSYSSGRADHSFCFFWD